MLMTKKSNIVDLLTEKAVNTGSKGMFKGAAASGIGIALISATRAVPEDWEQWIQLGCFSLIALGLLKTAYELFR